jgi:uncharacterized tellurite resistance protein B-like protein
LAGVAANGSMPPAGRPRRAQGSRIVASNWKDWIAQRFGATADAQDPARTRDLAVAALLVEVLRADYNSNVAERRQVIESVRGMLGLEAPLCEALIADAERHVDGAHDLHQFTSRLNDSLSHPEKIQLMEQLWRVAQADEAVHKYEEHLIRRVAGLLHVSHREFIAAKLRSSGA